MMASSYRWFGSIGWAGWVGWVVATALFLFHRVPPPPPVEGSEPQSVSGDEVPEVSPPKESTASEVPCSDHRPSYEGLEKLAYLAAEERWEGKVRSLEDDLRQAKRQGERYLAQLEQARGWLQSLDSRPTAKPSTAARAPRSRGKTKARVSAATPKVQLIGSDAFISGRVRNSGSAPARASLRLELLINGRTYDETMLHLYVPARSSLPYTHTFPTSLGDGTYAARVEVQAP